MPEIIYPPGGFYFKVTLQGDGIGEESSFQQVTGLTVEMSSDEITEGGENRFKHRLPTSPKYNNLILKRGLVTNSNLRKWIEKGINGDMITPVMVTITLLNEANESLRSWMVHNAWPVKWEFSSLDAMNNSLAIESLELAFDYFEIKT